MKLLITSDIHYRIKQFDWLLDMAPQYDAVIVAGDLLDLAGHADTDIQIAVVEKYLTRLAAVCPTIVSSGNHDGDVERESTEFVAEWIEQMERPGLTVDGQSVELNGLAITACPWRDGPLAQQSIETVLERQSGRQEEVEWAWLYHAPPDATPLAWTGKKYFGDELLNGFIARYRPAYVFCGHVHNAPYRDDGSWVTKLGSTWCFNPGYQMADVPCYIELDTNVREAMWHSEYGVRVQKLA